MATENYDILPAPPADPSAVNPDEKNETSELVSLVKNDLSDQGQWRSDQVKWRDHRDCRIKGKPSWPNGSNVVVDIIDENLCSVKEQMVSIFDNARRYMSFMPLDAAASSRKEIAETIFDSVLRYDLGFRVKNEIGIDRFLERGMCIFHVRIDQVRRRRMPVLEIVDPLDLIVPVECRSISEADRICRIHRFTERKFLEEAERQGWQDAATVWKSGSRKASSDTSGENGVSARQDNSATETITIWEIWHWRTASDSDDQDSMSPAPAKKFERYYSLVCPAVPNRPLKHGRWAWKPLPIDMVIGQDGSPVAGFDNLPVLDIPDRPWPWAISRLENKSEFIHESRGIPAIILRHQRKASNYENARNDAIELLGKPYLKGKESDVRNFRFRPGELLPNGVELVPPAAGIENIFSMQEDRTMQMAARRAGAVAGGINTTIPGKSGTKTASEVNVTQQMGLSTSQNMFNRYADGLAGACNLMWELWQRNPPAAMADIPIVFDQSGEPVQASIEQFKDILDRKYLIQSGVSGRENNPDFMLSMIERVSEQIGNGVNAGFIQPDRVLRTVLDLVSPRLADNLIAKPEQQLGAPIAEVVKQLSQAVQSMAARLPPAPGPAASPSPMPAAPQPGNPMIQ